MVQQERRRRHPMLSAFRTLSAGDYSEIATVPLDRCCIDLALEAGDARVAVVELDHAMDDMDSVVRMYDGAWVLLHGTACDRAVSRVGVRALTWRGFLQFVDVATASREPLDAGECISLTSVNISRGILPLVFISSSPVGR
jgi:hypothetical protein